MMSLTRAFGLAACAFVFINVGSGPAWSRQCRIDEKYAGLAPIDVFLVAGQSNATGVPDDANGSPKVPPGMALQYYNGRITDANDPVGNAEPGSAWPQFGITYHQKTGHKVLFVPASMPASSLTRRGDFLGKGHWDETGQLFFTAVNRTEAALNAAGDNARLAGILWDQGEADSIAINAKFETPADYEQALKALIARFRQSLDSPVPFLIFETGSASHKDPNGFEAVRAAQREVSRSVVASPIVFEDAITFPARNLMARNGLHYSQAGYNLMGLEGAEKTADFLSGQRSAPCTP